MDRFSEREREKQVTVSRMDGWMDGRMDGGKRGEVEEGMRGSVLVCVTAHLAAACC